jgi:hypothetical protein
MSDIIDAMIMRLNTRNLLPTELPTLIRDVMIIIGDRSQHTLESINRELDSLGWPQDLLDTYLFELILEYIETEGGYRVVCSTLH